MTGLDGVKHAIQQELEIAKAGVKECEEKLAAVERVKIEMSQWHNQITRLDAALRALDGTYNPPSAPVPKGRQLTGQHPSGLPPTSIDFFLGCIPEEGCTAYELLPVVAFKLGLQNVQPEQGKLLKGRISNAMSVLVKDGKLVQEGERGSYTYRRTGDD